VRESFRTVRREAEAEFTEKNSRFIGICRPIEEEADALVLLEDARVRYPEARHYVYAWRTDVPVQLQRMSDDGEPQGTGGRQVLSVLDNADIDRAAIVVVRYFGGILLGTGGLSRAYARAAREALEAAEPLTYVRCQTYRMTTDYATFHQLGARLERESFFTETPTYGAEVTQVVGATSDRIEQLCALVMDMSSGEATLEPAGDRWLPMPRSS
jgi:uncharacterized YigZ family protein